MPMPKKSNPRATGSPTARERQDAIARLRQIIAPGATIYTTLKYVSRSGLRRTIAVFSVKNNEPRDLSYLVAQALSDGFDARLTGVVVRGCGQDAGFALVDRLTSRLFPAGSLPLQQRWL